MVLFLEGLFFSKVTPTEKCGPEFEGSEPGRARFVCGGR